jgi:hypothetical protein
LPMSRLLSENRTAHDPPAPPLSLPKGYPPADF